MAEINTKLATAVERLFLRRLVSGATLNELRNDPVVDEMLWEPKKALTGTLASARDTDEQTLKNIEHCAKTYARGDGGLYLALESEGAGAERSLDMASSECAELVSDGDRGELAVAVERLFLRRLVRGETTENLRNALVLSHLHEESANDIRAALDPNDKARNATIESLENEIMGEVARGNYWQMCGCDSDDRIAERTSDAIFKALKAADRTHDHPVADNGGTPPKHVLIEPRHCIEQDNTLSEYNAQWSFQILVHFNIAEGIYADAAATREIPVACHLELRVDEIKSVVFDTRKLEAVRGFAQELEAEVKATKATGRGMDQGIGGTM